MERRRGAGRATAIVLVGITTLVLFEAVRVLLPLLYDLREDDGAATAVAVAVGVFAGAPALTGVVRRLFGATVSFVLCVLGLAGGAARDAARRSDPAVAGRGDGRGRARGARARAARRPGPR